MKQIKYSYCIDENDNLIHINTLTNETRHAHKWRCLQCGQEMVANLGTKKAWYFSHKADTACNRESYLHKLAKRRIREKFLSSDSFPITFVRNIPCNQQYKCIFFNNSECQVRNVSIPFDLKKWYDTCQEEITVGEFRPDLLLTCSTKPNRKPLFVEIYVNHPSEETKRNSKHKIIETTQIKSEDDIENIIKNGFIEDPIKPENYLERIINNESVEGDNCMTINFNPPLPPKRKDDVPITRFVLFKNGKARIYKDLYYKVFCNKLNEKVEQFSDCELNMKDVGIEIKGENANDKILDFYESGLIYLVKKKNWLIKNCFICKFRKHNGWSGEYICIRYKSLGAQYKYPKQTMAQDCPYYQIDTEKMNYPLSELEKIISEVPT